MAPLKQGSRGLNGYKGRIGWCNMAPHMEYLPRRWVVLAADKGVAMVVMEKQDYMDKTLSLISDTNTYRTINKDLTTKLRNQLINTLKDIKQTGGLNDSIYKKVHPTCAVPPKFYGLPKFTRWAPPQTHCIQQGFHHYGVAKVLAGIICPLVGQSPHHLKNTQHFVEHIKQVKLEPGEIISSFDVKALIHISASGPFHSNSAGHKLSQDTTLPQRTNMSISQIIKLLEFCLKHTYLLFQGKYYEQIHGAAMGSPISPLIANLFMEEFEVTSP